MSVAAGVPDQTARAWRHAYGGQPRAATSTSTLAAGSFRDSLVRWRYRAIESRISSAVLVQITLVALVLYGLAVYGGKPGLLE